MKLLDACMQGMTATLPDGQTGIVDFVLFTRTTTICLLPGWWVNPDFGAGWGMEGLLVFRGLRVDGQQWVADVEDGGVAVFRQGFDSEEQEKEFREMRMRQDIQRMQYMEGLRLLRKAFPDFPVKTWIIAMKQKTNSGRRESEKINLGLRNIGSIRLTDSNNRTIDALVVDEHGAVATVNSTPWLVSMANTWKNAPEPRDIQKFITWASNQVPYGPYDVSEPSVTTGEGRIYDLAVSQIG